jgi:hypothetical protein
LWASSGEASRKVWLMYLLYTLALSCLGLLIFFGSTLAFALSCLGFLVLLVAVTVLDVTWKYLAGRRALAERGWILPC